LTGLVAVARPPSDQRRLNNICQKVSYFSSAIRPNI
jgi:hypothetical protein